MNTQMGKTLSFSSFRGAQVESVDLTGCRDWKMGNKALQPNKNLIPKKGLITQNTQLGKHALHKIQVW